MKTNISALLQFFNAAKLAGYVGGGKPVETWNIGNAEYEHAKGKWLYRDSFAGFLQSWGKETIWFNNKPIWTQLYGGGMERAFYGDKTFVKRTFAFLQLALQKEPLKDVFQPRGPERFTDGDFEYYNSFRGNIHAFSGEEVIAYKKQSVFTHQFFGGLFLE